MKPLPFILLLLPSFLFSCSALAPQEGMGGSVYEISASLDYKDDYRDETSAGADRPFRHKFEETLTLFAQGSQFISKNASIGFTAIFEDQTTEYGAAKGYSRFLLASPRYYWSVTEDDSVALYAGPDLGLVLFGQTTPTEDYSGEAPAYGLTAGSKFYIGDHFSLFAEVYNLYFDREDSDGFTEDIDWLGLRLGFSVLW